VFVISEWRLALLMKKTSADNELAVGANARHPVPQASIDVRSSSRVWN
jgi:hypothetical protein